MSFGVYFHIPYCIQRCSYCDFSTYVQTEIPPPEEYVQLVLEEMKQRSFFQPQMLDTIYFGGGTPSLVPAPLILSLIEGLEKVGFSRSPGTEITIEINPATVDERKLNLYLEYGVNRFSVGAQTFDDRLLKLVKREHNAQQTLQTLQLLDSYKLNYSFDILFALPTQTKDGLQRDLEIALGLGAKHISPYCLTVPSGHPLTKGRPPEDEQVEMFELLKSELESHGFSQYEISNFSKPGFESRHNILYWSDQEYWGLGLSAHSYSKKSPWGSRFWNPPSFAAYEKLIKRHQGERFHLPEEALSKDLSQNLFETLAPHQALTDLCHTFLRRQRGLCLEDLQSRFSAVMVNAVQGRLENLQKRGLLGFDNEHWQLTPQGVLVSNLVFEELTFLGIPPG